MTWAIFVFSGAAFALFLPGFDVIFSRARNDDIRMQSRVFATRDPRSPDVLENAVQLVERVIRDHDLAGALLRVIDAYFRADLL